MRRIRTILLSLTLLLGGTAPVAPPAAGAVVAGRFTGTLSDGATWVADVPEAWNGTLVLFSHGFGPLVAQNRPSPEVGEALLAKGYALAGSSYAPGSLWALGSAVRDQLETAHAVSAIIGRPARTIALGQSMGGLVSARLGETGRVDGVLTICGIVAGGADLNNYQLNAGHALATLLAPGEPVQLTGFATAEEGAAAGRRLTGLVERAQADPAGRARVALAAALLNQADWYPGQPEPGPRDYPGQQEQQYRWLTEGSVLNFVFGGRYWIELAAGGDSAWNAGLDYERLLRHSPRLAQVRALYRAAGLDLRADLDTLTRSAAVRAEPAALEWMLRTSVPGGRLRAPELTVHTVSDQLVPVEQQHRYGERVRAAGRAGLLRQAYVARAGHCAFSTGETVAAVEAVHERVKTGRWGALATPEQLNRAARPLGEAAFTHFRPGPLVVQPVHPARAG